jgi:predicted metal-dependent hydrolase
MVFFMSPGSILYKITYRRIKNPRIEYRAGTLNLIVPFGYDAEILLNKYEKWISKKRKYLQECRDISEKSELVFREGSEFESLVFKITARLSAELELTLKEIAFRKMKARWASMTSKRKMTINRAMCALPEYLLEYIIFHELVHLIEMKHSKRFREIISIRYRDFKKIDRQLYAYCLKIFHGGAF